MLQVVEVGPRDGLQNEKIILRTGEKVQLINRLSQSGLKSIEIGSFVRPDWIPALADTVEVARQIERVEGVSYSALVPNAKGLERALEAEMNEVAIFMSVTESHNRSNTNRSTEEALKSYKNVVANALSAGIKVRAYLSTVFGCPYEGKVTPEQVLPLVSALLEMGAYQVSLGDTTGVSDPVLTRRVIQHLKPHVPLEALALHMHDTRGTALANVYAGWLEGVETFDTSIGGLGGCPYAPGASGNLATEDLVYMFQAMQVETGIDLEALVQCNQLLQQRLSRKLPGKYAQTQLG